LKQFVLRTVQRQSEHAESRYAAASESPGGLFYDGSNLLSVYKIIIP